MSTFCPFVLSILEWPSSSNYIKYQLSELDIYLDITAKIPFHSLDYVLTLINSQLLLKPKFCSSAVCTRTAQTLPLPTRSRYHRQVNPWALAWLEHKVGEEKQKSDPSIKKDGSEQSMARMKECPSVWDCLAQIFPRLFLLIISVSAHRTPPQASSLTILYDALSQSLWPITVFSSQHL